MSNLVLEITGSASAAENAVDSLIGKLQSLSSTLDGISSKVRSAFGGFNNINVSGLDGVGDKINELENRLSAIEGKNIAPKMDQTADAIKNVGKSASTSAGFLGKLGKSIGRIAFYRLLRTALKEVAAAFKEGLNNAYAFSKLHGGPLATAMDKIRSSATTMKNQLGAAFGGLITAIAPVITFLTSILTRFATFLTQIFALLGGQKMYKVATDGFNSIEESASGAGGAVKGLLAPWDELNVIGQEKGGGGGSSALDNAAGMFEYAEMPEWLSNIWESSGIGETIERLKKSWEDFKKTFEEYDFASLINIAIIDPLRTVIDTLDGVLMLLRGIMSGDLWVVGNAAGKIIFDSIMNTVVIPFWRTFDMLFGTDLTSIVLDFKNFWDNIFHELSKPEFVDGVRKNISDAFKKAWESVKTIWDKVSTWFKTKVINPLVTFFKTAWTNIKKFFTSAWDGIKSVWGKVSTWFNDKVVKPIKSFFEPIVQWFGTLFKAAWQIIRAIWVIVADWFNKNVVEPIKKFFKAMWDAIKSFASAAWTEIKRVWNVAANWFNTNVINPLKNAWNSFKTAVVNVFSTAWDAIKKAALTFALWVLDNIAEPIALWFAKAFDSIYGAYLSIKNSIMKSLAKVYNWIATNVVNPVIDKINAIGRVAAKILGEEYTDIKKIGTISESSFGKMGDESATAADTVKKNFSGLRTDLEKKLSVRPTIKFKYQNDHAQLKLTAKLSNGKIVGLSNVKVLPNEDISMYAEGGFPSSGQLFVANESGPEMVGRIGSHTAVANNDQIVSSVKYGVAEANAEGNALLAQLVSVGQRLLNKELVITPSIALGQVVQRSSNMYARS